MLPLKTQKYPAIASLDASSLHVPILEDESIQHLFTDLDFPPLVNTGLTTAGTPPHSLIASPSFADPTLQKSLNIFSDKTLLSQSVLPLDSIRFENVTIRRKKHNSSSDAATLAPTPYSPLSTRLKNVAHKPASSSQRVLRASTPLQFDT